MKKHIFIMNMESRALMYGVGTYTKQLISALKLANFHITVVTLYADTGGELTVSHKREVRFIHFPKPSIDGYDQLFFTREDNAYQKGVYYNLLSFIPKDEDIYFHFNFMELSAIAQLLKINMSCKIILTVHYTFWSFELEGDVAKLHRIIEQPDNQWESGIQKSFLNDKFFLNDIAGYVIAIANHSAQMLNTLYGVDASKITLIPNGLDDNYQERTMEDKRGIRKRFCIGEHEKVLLFVGRVTPVKGVGQLIEAFKLVLEQLPDSRLIIVGEGLERDMQHSFKQCCPVWSKICFTGYVPKDIILELYAVADIGIVPSIHEEFGYVAVEMMMAYLPVLANKTTGLLDIIEENVTGTFVTIERDNPEFSRLFASKIVSLLQNAGILGKYAQNGRRIFMERYVSTCFYENILSFYNRVNIEQMAGSEKPYELIFLIMVLKKMSIGELQSDSNEVLLRERMKAIKAGKKAGDCYVYCHNGNWGLAYSCSDGSWICGSSGGWLCTTWDDSPCE